MAQSETKICQNCHNDFIIESEDFLFYEKIKVPAPTWCPECRMVRRMMFRNERTLYRRVCDLCGKDIISIYSPTSPFTVYCYECWYSDKWNPLSYGRNYNFSKPFFQQFFELEFTAPKLAQQKSNDLVNSDYTNHVGGLKDCYLIFASVNDEECYFCNYVSYSKNIVDGLRISKGEISYDCVDLTNCYNLKFSQQCQDCFDSWFLYNCRGCSNCFLCTNLMHKSYCIRNKQYIKDAYFKELEKMNINSREVVEKLKAEFVDLKRKTIKRATEGFNNHNSTGSYLKNTKNCKNCFDVGDAEDCSYVGYGNNVKDVMDAYAVYPTTELCYEVVGAGNPTYHSLFTYLPWAGSYLEYCINAFSNCHNCFGCNQVRNAQYCILNKQYTKEEYETLVPKIIEHMNSMPYIDKKGRVYKYGEFFPPELSPFCYNETIAQEYFPLTKEQALEQGYSWKDSEERNLKIDIKTEDLPDHIKDVKDDIINKIIECQHQGKCNEQCTEAFKIIPQELEFYRKMNLPLPRLCPNCRHYQRLKQRNPLKLWKRKCQCNGEKSSNGVYQNTIQHFHGNEPCPNEFETTYAPERPEIVYCEKCYQQEVV